jgi:hypothetical protein
VVESSNSLNKRNWFHGFTWSNTLSLAVVLLVVIAAAIYTSVHNSRSQANNYSYSYKKMTASLITGSGPGTGLYVQRPVEFSQEQLTKNTNVAFFVHVFKPKGGKDAVIGAESALSNPAPATFSAQLLPLYGSTSSPQYSKAIQPYENYLKSVIPILFFPGDNSPKMTLKIDKPGFYSTRDLIKGAWVMPFSASDDSFVMQSHPHSIKGELIVAQGKTNYYYVMVSTIDKNWQPNHFSWSKALGSLQVDL